MTVRFMSLVHSLSFYLSMKLEEMIGSIEAMLIILFIHCIKCDSMSDLSAEHNGFYVAKNDAELLSQSFLGHLVW